MIHCDPVAESDSQTIVAIANSGNTSGANAPLVSARALLTRAL